MCAQGMNASSSLLAQPRYFVLCARSQSGQFFFKRYLFCFVFLMPRNFASVKVVNLLLIVKLGCKHWSSFHSFDLGIRGHFGETALMEPCFGLGEGKQGRFPTSSFWHSAAEEQGWPLTWAPGVCPAPPEPLSTQSPHRPVCGNRRL